MKHHILFFGAVMLFFSCGNHSEETDMNSEAVDSLVKEEVVAEVVEPEETFDLPSPLRIASTFKRSGLKFIEVSLNSLENSKQYNTKYSKALNLGVYSADMAYCLLNKQYSQSKNYLKTCKEIGADLGLNSAFESNNLAIRFENNLGKDDSLMKLVADLQLETDLVLEQSNQQYISALIFTGAWIETLHSAEQVYIKGEEKMTPVLLEQMLLLNNLISVLERQKEKDEKIEILIADLTAMQTEFNSIDELKDKDMEEFDFADLKLKPKALNSLCEKIEVLRNTIIKG